MDRRRRLARTLAELALIAAFQLVYHAPYLQAGLPPGDFGSDLMVAERERRIVPTPLDFPVWVADFTCGRPLVGFWRPTRLLELPFSGLDPLDAQKRVVLLFHVLAGWSMYALLRGSGAGSLAAVFGGLCYPMMPSHVARAAIHGHVHVLRFFAVLPLLLLAFFRAREARALRTGASAARATVLLGLAFAAALLLDAQRTLLVAVLLGILLALELAGAGLRDVASRRRGAGSRGEVDAEGGRSDPEPVEDAGAEPERVDGEPAPPPLSRLPEPLRSLRDRPWLPPLAALGLFAAAFAAAVGVAAFELVNSFIGDGYRFGFTEGHLEFFLDRWSNDNLYTFVDRLGVLGYALEDRVDGFYASSSRYLGLTLLVCIAAGIAFAPAGRGRRFWTALGLAVLALWLAAGPTPLWPSMLERWTDFLASPDVPAAGKGLAFVSALALLGLGIALAARRLGSDRPPRRAWRLAALGVFGGLLAFVCLAPYPVVRTVVFFLRDHRNPDWFQVAVLSSCTVFAAALGLSWLAERWQGRTWGRAAVAAIALVALVDLAGYRPRLTSKQLGPEVLDSLREVAARIAEDPDDVRVLTAENYSNLGDAIATWHDKRLAWDFRHVTAPVRTRQLVTALHGMMERDPRAAPVASLANVRWVVDVVGKVPDVDVRSPFRLAVDTPHVRLLENESVRPVAQFWPQASLLVSSDADLSVVLTAGMAFAGGRALVGSETTPPAELLAQVSRVFADAEAMSEGIAPAGAEIVAVGERLPLQRLRPLVPPEHEVSRARANVIEIDVDTPADVWMMISESYHPRWSAHLDGEPVAHHPVNHAFVGVFVPAGRHRVVLEYSRRWDYFVWLFVSLGSGLAALTVVLRTRPAPPEQAEGGAA